MSRLGKSRLVAATILGLVLPSLVWNGDWVLEAETVHAVDRAVAAGGDNPYSFGSCPSQGAWTQSALSHMRSLYDVVKRLKDNPKCAGKENTIDGIITNFKSAEVELELAKNDTFASKAETLPGEIDALSRLLPGTKGALGESLGRMLFRRNLDAATLGSKKAAEDPTLVEGVVDPSAAVRALYHRTSRASRYGMKMVQQIMTALPTLDECIMGQPDLGLALVGAAVKVGAAFTASGDSLGNSVGSVIGSLVTLMRDRRFTKAMRQLNEREFWMSISCMLETTTKNYCEAENAQEMLAYAEKEYARSMEKARMGAADPNSDNPLEGYYLLSRELPSISNWLTQVKLGVEPRTTADASQQSNAIDRINDFWKLKKDLSGFMNLQIQTVMALPELSARQIGMLQLVKDIVYKISKGQGAIFVTQAVNDAFLPFYLVGLESIPAAVRPDVKVVRKISWEEWMEAGAEGGKLQPFFEDPVALSRKLEERVRLLLEAADRNAAAFFRQYLVVDLQNLVNLTLTGQNMTVRESFLHVVRYLERFEKRLIESNVRSDLGMLASVKQTQEKIKDILRSYEKMMAIGRDYRAGRIQIDSRTRVLDEAAKAIIDIVFDHFEVLYLSDVFLTNQMTTFIQRDFAIRLRNGLGLTEHQREILFVTREHLLQRILQNFGQNMTHAKTDLANAQLVNRTTLYSFEEVFGDQIFLILEELNEIVHGRDASPAALKRLAEKRFARDRLAERWKTPLVTVPNSPVPVPFVKSLKELWYWIMPGQKLRDLHNDLYTRPSNELRVTGGDTKFGDFARFRAVLCAQTLAFQSRDRFHPLCQDAVVTSAYSDVTAEGYLSNLDLSYDNFWPKNVNESGLKTYAEKIKKDPEKTSVRICAYNNFGIRNWVRMLQDRDAREEAQKADLSEEFDFERQEREARAQTEARAEADTTAATLEPQPRPQ